MMLVRGDLRIGWVRLPARYDYLRSNRSAVAGLR